MRFAVMAVVTILTIGGVASAAVDNKHSHVATVAAEAAHWPRSLTADQVGGIGKRFLRTDNAVDQDDYPKRHLSSESTAVNDEERTSLARLAVAKLQLKYWSFNEANPNVVYRGFGLHKKSGKALEKSKLLPLWKGYAQKWAKKQAQISI
ncbi:hypothetical protein PR003_g32032 [Phytophthora rubi]|nr:hypothetical protein PR001_g30944 [Phytophthora rubi]KAE9266695.1 hypothetical protein PR003_g32032 [Phytophthora rubi]